MKFSKKPIALAAFTLLAGAPIASQAAVTVYFKAPASGTTTTLTNTTWNQSTTACELGGSGIARAQFMLVNSSGTIINLNNDTSSPFRCDLVSTNYPNGNYQLRVYAYDTAGNRAISSRSVIIKNSTTTTPTTPTVDAKPTISFAAPLNNATVGTTTTCRVNASDDKGIKQVQFFMDGNLIGTDTSSSYTCNIVNTQYTNGAHTLKAVVTDTANQTTETQIAINITGGIGTSTGGSTGGSSTLPSIAFTAPAAGVPLKGNVQGPPNCTVTGTNIARIMFYINDVWTNTDGNPDNGWGCWIDTTKYKDGAYTVKAVAYNAAGQTTTVTHPVTIQNGTTTTTPNAAPTVGITTPGSGATLAGTSVPYTLTAGDTDGTVASVELKLISGSTTKVVATKNAAPWSGTFSTSGLPNGTATLMATATDNLGKATSVQRSVTINNTVVSNPGGDTGGGSTGSIAPEHIISKARADVSFSSQTGYHSQVMGKSTQAASIPESGITGPVLPNGETLRLGKVNDPAGSGAKVFHFQVHPSDPNTSGSKRAEFAFNSNIEMDKVYWVAVSTFIPDWGTLNSGDDSLFGTQMHSGDNSRSLSPSFGLYTMPGGRNFKVVARWSTSSDPQQGNSVKANYAERPIPFGRWADFVLKFKHNTSGNGFLQVWMDGELIATHNGNLGFNTPGFKDYAKFGYYNWSSGMNSSRKVILRSPTIVADPTGSTYSAAQVRALLGSSESSAAGGGSTTTTSSTGGSTTTADSGVCSSASCVLTQ